MSFDTNYNKMCICKNVLWKKNLLHYLFSLLWKHENTVIKNKIHTVWRNGISPVKATDSINITDIYQFLKRKSKICNRKMYIQKTIVEAQPFKNAIQRKGILSIRPLLVTRILYSLSHVFWVPSYDHSRKKLLYCFWCCCYVNGHIWWKSTRVLLW